MESTLNISSAPAQRETVNEELKRTQQSPSFGGAREERDDGRSDTRARRPISEEWGPSDEDRKHAERAGFSSERILLEAFASRLFLIRVAQALRRVNRMLTGIATRDVKLPLIFVTGEFFANLAHNEGNYNLRRFIDQVLDVAEGLLENPPDAPGLAGARVGLDQKARVDQDVEPAPLLGGRGVP